MARLIEKLVIPALYVWFFAYILVGVYYRLTEPDVMPTRLFLNHWQFYTGNIGGLGIVVAVIRRICR